MEDKINRLKMKLNKKQFRGLPLSERTHDLWMFSDEGGLDAFHFKIVTNKLKE